MKIHDIAVSLTTCSETAYSVRYSQANLEIVPSRTDFATLVKDGFENAGGHNTLVQQNTRMEIHITMLLSN